MFYKVNKPKSYLHQNLRATWLQIFVIIFLHTLSTEREYRLGILSITEGIPPSSGPVRSNKQCAARRLADKLGLMPYQNDALSEPGSAARL